MTSITVQDKLAFEDCNKRADRIIDILFALIGEAKSELNYNSNFQLLVAVALSAQCTDKRVNMVTSKLFARAGTPQIMQAVSIDELEDILHSLGFFRAKAKNIKQLSKELVDRYDGVVPNDRDSLVALSGVGQKTANVVLMECFGMPYIAVDTHVYRVSRRLGLSFASTPNAVESDLYRYISPSKHLIAHHTLLLFGRYYCKAQRPNCANCIVSEYCNYNK